MLPRILAGLLAVVVVFGQGRANGQTRPLTIAAASDLRTVFPELVAGFERETGVKPTVTFGSSGNFLAQIQNGAPYDLFFAADLGYPRRLAASGHADSSTLYQYATGRIVLWTRKDSGIDISSGLAILRDPRVRRIAIANPKVAPYGRAAEAALRSSKLSTPCRASWSTATTPGRRRNSPIPPMQTSRFSLTRSRWGPD